ncbi:MAG: LPS assembly protein LptD [Candidatus Aminicenantales bacterium]
MSKSALWKIVLFALLCLSLPSVVRAQQKTVATFGELNVQAWTQEKQEDRIIASGEVELTYKQIKLFCDRIDLDTKTKDVVAVGHVSLQMPEEVIDCEKLSFNLDTKQGKIEKAAGRIQPSVLYNAEVVERKSENLYSMEKADFTACTQPTPRWKFSFSKGNFKKNDYVEMWGVVFSIKNFPIFYWPYMRYPLNQQRATGFLMPRIGFSKVKGFSLSEEFYWAIARNMDASFSLDYYAAKGKGGGLEYRYIFEGGTGGELHLYGFLFNLVPGETVKPDSAYIIRWNHNQTLPGGINLVANVDYQNSFAFLREFDNDIMRALVFNRSSQIYLSKSWSSYNFSLRAAQFETGFPSYNGSIVTKYLPQVNFSSYKMKILSPLYFSFSSSFSSWQYGWDYQYTAGTQFKTQEFGFSPALSLPFNAIPWLNMNFALEGYLKYYWRSYQPGTRNIVDEPLLTKNFAFSVDLIGPVLYKIWDLGEADGGDPSNATRLKHVIEPTVSYEYESPILNMTQVITPYGLFRYHQLSYGLTNHFLLKKGGVPQEIFTWGIGQTFYISPEDSPMSYYRINGEIPRFSEISNYIRFFPGVKYSFDFSASYNTYFKSFSSIRLGANFGAPTDDLFLNINWYKSLNPYYPGSLWDRHQANFFGGVKIPALSLEMKGEMDFNITEKKLLFAAANVTFHFQCLDLKSEVRLYFFRDTPDIQIKFSLGLGNIGKTTDFLGGARWN